MTALRETIFVEIEQRLNAIAGVAEVERMPSGDPFGFPALHIYDRGQREAEETGANVAMHTLDFEIEGFIEQAAGATAHAALSDLYARVVAALMAEPPIAGIVEDVAEGSLAVEVAALASSRRLGFALDFTVTYPTRRDDPAQPA